MKKKENIDSKKKSKKDLDKKLDSAKVEDNHVLEIKEDILLNEKDLKKSKTKNSDEDDEPSWYHYLIIIGIVLGSFALLYFGFNFFFDNSDEQMSPIENNSEFQRYIYQHKVGNVTYNIELNSPVSEIEKMNYTIEATKYDFYNSITVTMSFLEYNGTDNGYVSVSAGKFTNFLKRIFHLKFNEDNFKMINNSNCMTATSRDMVVIFNPYSNISGVYYNGNGCVEILAQSAPEIVNVTDKFIYSLIT